MKFSIVTPSLNCGSYIRRNISSIRAQGFSSNQLEHWVIDGGSTDGTIDILGSEPGLHWISESDAGLSDAVNKGIRRAKGEWIIWLNADDELAPSALQTFSEEAERSPGISMFCGGQKVFGYDGELEVVSKGWSYTFEDLLTRRTAINQASTFVHRRVYERVGLLDPTFRFAMDYEWVVRAVQKFECGRVDTVLTHYHRRVGSIMDAGIAGQHREYLRVAKQYRRSPFGVLQMKIRCYLATDFLRRRPWIRQTVRQMKSLAR